MPSLLPSVFKFFLPPCYFQLWATFLWLWVFFSFIFRKKCSVQFMFSYIKMMGEGITMWLICSLPDPLGKALCIGNNIFSPKNICPSFPALFFIHNPLPIVAAIWLMFRINILINSENFSDILKIEVFRSQCASLLFLRQKYFLLCTSSYIYFWIFNVFLS